MHICPRSLRGTIDVSTGVVNLDFVADFTFTFDALDIPLYTAAPLPVTTRLTTEAIDPDMRNRSK